MGNRQKSREVSYLGHEIKTKEFSVERLPPKPLSEINRAFEKTPNRFSELKDDNLPQTQPQTTNGLFEPGGILLKLENSLKSIRSRNSSSSIIRGGEQTIKFINGKATPGSMLKAAGKTNQSFTQSPYSKELDNPENLQA